MAIYIYIFGGIRCIRRWIHENASSGHQCSCTCTSDLQNIRSAGGAISQMKGIQSKGLAM